MIPCPGEIQLILSAELIEAMDKELRPYTGGITREQILDLEARMLADLDIRGIPHTPGNTDDLCPVKHHFAPGLYAREILLPAGVRIIGKIHRHAHINTISAGRVLVFTEFGSSELVAPVTFVSIPGTKRVVFAIEETMWTTYHPTDEVDLGRIEGHVIAPTFEEYERGQLMVKGAQSCHGAL